MSWYRGKACNFLPTKEQLQQPNNLVENVLAGWIPDKPRITEHTKITAFGSCFAHHIAAWLNKRKFNIAQKTRGSKQAYIVECGDGLVSTFTIKQQFDWAINNKTFAHDLWFDDKGRVCGQDREVQSRTAELMKTTDTFILTFGLAEIWYNKETDDVYWRSIPEKHFDPNKNGFRVSTVEENKKNIVEICKTIKRIRPEADVILTLSPVPLHATFRPSSCLTASCASKAILRAAIDEALPETSAYYWPSYELVTELFPDPWMPDRRHPKKEVLDFVMTLFQTHWCTTPPGGTPEQSWRAAIDETQHHDHR
jgi:hypothetical protein